MPRGVIGYLDVLDFRRLALWWTGSPVPRASRCCVVRCGQSAPDAVTRHPIFLVGCLGGDVVKELGGEGGGELVDGEGFELVVAGDAVPAAEGGVVDVERPWM